MKKVKIVSLFLYIIFILLASSFVLAHPGHGSEYATEVTSSGASDSGESSYSNDYSSNSGSSQSSYSGQGSSSRNNEKAYSDNDNSKSNLNDNDKTNLDNNNEAINSNSSYNNTSSIELVENENDDLFSLNNIIILVIVFISGVLIVVAINKFLL